MSPAQRHGDSAANSWFPYHLTRRQWFATLATIVVGVVAAVVGYSAVFLEGWVAETAIILTPGAAVVGVLLVAVVAYQRPTRLGMVGVFTGVILSYVLFDPVSELLAVTLGIGGFALFVALPLAPVLGLVAGGGLVLASASVEHAPSGR